MLAYHCVQLLAVQEILLEYAMMQCVRVREKYKAHRLAHRGCSW
jgi:hypothetical protein